MLNFSQLSKSYVFQRDYCHTKVNDSNFFSNFSWLTESTQPYFSFAGKTFTNSVSPQNQWKFYTKLKENAKTPCQKIFKIEK